jgi:hydrogenase nickel incorporation protein HypA/HybF
MHELPVTERILDVILSHVERNQVEKVVRVNLRVGELSDLEDEWIQHYFSYLAKDTKAAEAKLIIERVPVVISCSSCSHEFQVNIKEMKEIQCPECSEKKGSMISGKEYYIKDMEVI